MHDLHRLWTSLTADLGWVDLGALTALALFFLLGLIRGLVWQVGRVGALVGAGAASCFFAPPLADYLFAGTPAAPVQVYVGYVVVFLLAFLVLSWTAGALHTLVRRSSISVYDRLGGGLLGLGTGSVVVLGLLLAASMFARPLGLYRDVEASHAMRVGRATIAALGDWVPAPVHAAFLDAPVEPREREARTQPLSVATPALDRLLETHGR